MISPQKPLNKDNITSALLSLLRGFLGEISVNMINFCPVMRVNQGLAVFAQWAKA